MHLSWLGGTAIRLQTKPMDHDVVVVIDPYKPAQGSFPRSLTPDIVLYTRGQGGSITISGSPFLLDTSGECETHGVLVSAIHGHEPGQLLLRLDSEHMSLGHLGLAQRELTDEQLDVVGGVDILFIPVGGVNCYDAEAAVKIVNAVEPRVVVPIAFHCDTDPKTGKVEAFLKEMGVTNGAPEKKFILKKKDLPQEETWVIVLSKE